MEDVAWRHEAYGSAARRRSCGDIEELTEDVVEVVAARWIGNLSWC